MDDEAEAEDQDDAGNVEDLVDDEVADGDDDGDDKEEKETNEGEWQLEERRRTEQEQEHDEEEHTSTQQSTIMDHGKTITMMWRRSSWAWRTRSRTNESSNQL